MAIVLVLVLVVIESASECRPVFFDENKRLFRGSCVQKYKTTHTDLISDAMPEADVRTRGYLSS